MNDETTNRIKEIFEEATGISIENLDPLDNFRDATEVESVQFIGFLSRLEKKFNIELPLSIMEAENLHEFMKIFDEQSQK